MRVRDTSDQWSYTAATMRPARSRLCILAGFLAAGLWALAQGVAVIVTALFLIVWIAREAGAQSGRHGHGHDEHHDWYKDLKQPGSYLSCCNKLLPDGTGDCRPVRAYIGDDGLWRALVDGRRIVIPADKVLKNPDGSALVAPDGNSHACVSALGTIYCFIEAVPKS